MDLKYGKPIDPEHFQQRVISDIKAYLGKMNGRAAKYAKKAKIKVTQCYICDSKKLSAPVLSVYGFDYVQCKNCGHIFTTRRLSQEELNAYYQESSEYSTTYTDPQQIQYRLKNIAKPKVEYAMHFAPKKKGGRWLDIGSAIGDIVKSVDSYSGWTGTGLEISKQSVKTGKKIFQIDLRLQLFKDFSKEHPDAKFDVISLFGYLEVISDPVAEMQLVKKHLKKKGLVVIGEANADSLSTILQQSYPKLSRRHLLPPTVIQQFSLKSVTRLLHNIGAEPVGYWNFGLDFYEFLGHMSILNKDFQDSPTYRFMVQNLNAFQLVIDKKGKGDCFVIVGKLK